MKINELTKSEKEYLQLIRNAKEPGNALALAIAILQYVKGEMPTEQPTKATAHEIPVFDESDVDGIIKAALSD